MKDYITLNIMFDLEANIMTITVKYLVIDASSLQRHPRATCPQPNGEILTILHLRMNYVLLGKRFEVVQGDQEFAQEFY